MSQKTARGLSSGSEEVIYVFKTYNVSDLEGKILTFIDASTTDPIQRKAAKDIIREIVWSWAIQNNHGNYCKVVWNPTYGELKAPKND